MVCTVVGVGIRVLGSGLGFGLRTEALISEWLFQSCTVVLANLESMYTCVGMRTCEFEDMILRMRYCIYFDVAIFVAAPAVFNLQKL